MIPLRFTEADRFRVLKSVVCLAGSLTLAAGPAASAQSTAASTASPAAYVYVSFTPAGSSANKVMAFTAAANGHLTVVPGSPFVANVGSLASNGKFLFGSTTSGTSVSSFLIKSNGALQYTHTTNVDSPDATGCYYSQPLLVDHSGADVYRVQNSSDMCDHTHYQSWKIDQTSGALQFLGKSGDVFLYNDPLTISASNKFAYATQCTNYRGFPSDTFTGYVRTASGLLNVGSMSIPDPATKDPNNFYCRSYTASDPTNHIASTFVDTNFNDPYSSPAAQIGTYTIDGSGNLTTSSTYANMPSVAVGSVGGLAMSPSGKLLAVGGSGGLQIFHFNGASPATHFTGLLTTSAITQMFWDKSNHLYALSSAGKLYVYTVTPTSATAASGSPYTIHSPANLAVRPF